jgi:hypothetical protein
MLLRAAHEITLQVYINKFFKERNEEKSLKIASIDFKSPYSTEESN